jgi:hypothetical protein
LAVGSWWLVVGGKAWNKFLKIEKEENREKVRINEIK